MGKRLEKKGIVNIKGVTIPCVVMEDGTRVLGKEGVEQLVETLFESSPAELGVGGAALASVMAEISACLIFIFYTLLKLPIKQYALFSFHKLEGWLMLTVLKTAFPTMVQKLLSFGTWYIFFMLIEHMGERPIAITIIVRSVYMLILIPVFGYGATANTLTSRLIGEQRQPEIMSTLRRIMKLSMLSVLPVLLICYVFPYYVLSIYSNSLELIAASTPSLYVIGLAALSFCFGITFFEAISAAQPS